MYDKRRKRFTGLATLGDFDRWYGRSLNEVAQMQFTEMEKLPGVVNREIISMGGSYLQAFKLFSWRWTILEKSTYLRRGELFMGRGETYNEAALAGLLTLFEMVMLRKTQGTLVIK